MNKEYYPSPSEISSVDKNLEFVPESLQLFLQDILSEKNTNLKVSSLDQAVIQGSRPRSIISPLQIALGVQLHHCFASRFLIETLFNLGFCSSYPEVQKFETSAALAKGIDIPG